jgi:RNA polymerase sigma-70 factor, ECF subfamily
MTTRRLPATDQHDLLTSAREGDEGAYQSLVEGHTAELHAHCYRMLASLDDADDALQETLVRAWKGLSGFESRSSLRTWLFRIATNVALDASSRRARRELPVELGMSGGGEPTDLMWLEPYPDQLVAGVEQSPEALYDARESLEIAFVAGLQHLPTQQRAALILREVLGFSAQEVAGIIGSSVAAVNSALQRARATLSSRRPGRSQQSELAALGPDRTTALASRYARVIEESDIDGLLGLLTADASWSMPPAPIWYQGHQAIARFQTDEVFLERWRHRATSASGQLAVGCYTFDPTAGAYLPVALDVLTLRDGKIAAVIGFITPRGLSPDEQQRYGHLQRSVDFTRFALPDRLP